MRTLVLGARIGCAFGDLLNFPFRFLALFRHRGRVPPDLELHWQKNLWVTASPQRGI